MFARAHALAPDWAYPLYDVAFTYLLMGDEGRAEEYYASVDRLEPRGFFTSKTFIDSLRRERLGHLPAHFSKAFFLLEHAPRAQKRGMFQKIAERFPHFPPAWKELAVALDDADGRLAAIERGLALDPDRETLGMLIINKALALQQRGKREQAVRLLSELALDQEATVGTEMLSKLCLRQILGMPQSQ